MSSILPILKSEICINTNNRILKSSIYILNKIGKKLGLNAQSVLGIITSSINAIPTFSMTDKMNNRGVVMNIAFIVCGAFVFGDHLAFQATVDSTTVMPTLISKLCGGIMAIILTLLFTKKDELTD